MIMDDYDYRYRLIYPNDEMYYNDEYYTIVNTHRSSDKKITNEDEYKEYLNKLTKHLITKNIQTKDDMFKNNNNIFINNKIEKRKTQSESLSLKNNDDIFTKNNIEKKVKSLEKIKYNNMNIEICNAYLEKSNEGYKIYKYINDGIPKYIKLYNRENDISLKTIHDNIISEKITKELINKLIDNLRKNSDYESKEITEKFIDNLLTFNGSKLNKDFIDRIKKLLIFWSGVDYYMDDKKYQIKIIYNRPFESLPTSHTCFCILDYPPQKNEEKEYDILGKTMLAIESNSTLDLA